jgi:hypothetical protein
METKPVTIRMPVEVFDWLRDTAARETIRRKKVVSLNGFVVELLRAAMDADTQKGV